MAMEKPIQNPTVKQQTTQDEKAVDRAIDKVKQELKDPEIRAVFMRLKNK